jgi:hypothetical protein
VAKKHPNKFAKAALSAKEQSQAQIAEVAPRYATPEMVEKAISHIFKVHGAVLQKLAR